MTDLTTDLSARLARFDEEALLVPLLRLLVDGDPVIIDDLAAATRLPVDEVRTRLAASPETEYDDQGRIIGQGLTLRPTRHRFTVAGEELYTWCAFDTLIFPALLDRPARIESTSPASGDTIRVSIDPTVGITSVEPATAVMSLVNAGDKPSIRSSFCNQVHYFTSPQDAAGWLTEHPGAQILPVSDAFELGSTVVTGMLEHPQPGTRVERSGNCCGPDTGC
ncbi:organomercurial lyase MerB [Microbacterium sp. BF1]|uniref:organomercurial lyase MerB n=1 Tax=Microbacterium sp. BF1 TaxID=2821146 RepID=UPI001C4DFB7F|nr:organomercurial lyase MerB [Microbacterium sp. BF1]